MSLAMPEAPLPEPRLLLPVAGMTCAACVGRVERALAAVPGVLAVQVNLATGRAHLRVLAGTSEAMLGAALARAGYRLAAADRGADADPGAARERRDLPQAALATPVVFGLGARFWRAGFAALRAGSGNMDQLVAIGTGAAIAALLDLAPRTARRIEDGAEREVPAAIGVSRRTQSKIRQNLAWAFGYNLVGLPLAAAGMLSPVVAWAAMALSSVSVPASALWLARWRPREAPR